ncbi:MAG: hypothetical protein A2Y62_18495 [Candidatus Fischerbacteria bacterium RBG_13_37_8]|uniref:Uncharacterized protein n=1 Tax=Candidatus Fischerbacteria bacterium RBG_13_37_8 TaxID=1817863 RepID=A0A1F5V9A5_9BACT|nr:MAG: hypothetical protein A2Y62_18495 [Candidatus Fischerbacteria bacterium RBG_13_37_8]
MKEGVFRKFFFTACLVVFWFAFVINVSVAFSNDGQLIGQYQFMLSLKEAEDHVSTSIAEQQRVLTFEERVECQRAIEEVYYRHRIWPRECNGEADI